MTGEPIRYFEGGEFVTPKAPIPKFTMLLGRDGCPPSYGPNIGPYVVLDDAMLAALPGQV